jgi:membrane associated rhomboid family serine protease
MIPLKDENPSSSFPLVTLGLIAANIAVFLYTLSQPAFSQERFIMGFGMIPSELLGNSPRLHQTIPGVLTLLTSMFMHGGLLHLLGNMLYLWIFGNNIEDLLGRVRFLIFYLACGVFAALAHLVLNPNSTMPMVGASGAIAGVLGAYLISFPRARVLVLVFIIFFITTARVPAFWVLGLWFIMQLMYVSSDAGAGANIAYMAHIGGFLIGMLLIRKMSPFRGWRAGWR